MSDEAPGWIRRVAKRYLAFQGVCLLVLIGIGVVVMGGLCLAIIVGSQMR